MEVVVVVLADLSSVREFGSEVRCLEDNGGCASGARCVSA